MSSAEAVAAPVAGSLDDLQGQTCRGLCGRDTPRVADAALPRYLSLLPAWTLSKDKTSISRSFTARNFMAGGHAGWLAEEFPPTPAPARPGL